MPLRTRRKIMVIDVRLRPLYGGFLRQVRNPTSADFSAQLGMVKPASVRELSVELMLREMDEAGVTLGIAPGRNGHFRYNVSNDEVVETVEHFGGRFAGIAGINGADTARAVEEIDRYVVNGPLIGVNMEPGAMPEPWYADDRRLYPIYEKCAEHKIPVVLMLGGRAGPDISYSSPVIISRLARDFPGVSFLVSHGGWPWVQPLLGACFWQHNIYIAPDLYLMNSPGAQDYVAAANTFMQDRFLFGSAYPLMPIGDSLNKFKTLFNPEVLPKLLYRNAARLFNLTLSDEHSAQGSAD